MRLAPLGESRRDAVHTVYGSLLVTAGKTLALRLCEDQLLTCVQHVPASCSAKVWTLISSFRPSGIATPAEDLVHEPVDQPVKRGVVQERLASTDPPDPKVFSVPRATEGAERGAAGPGSAVDIRATAERHHATDAHQPKKMRKPMTEKRFRQTKHTHTTSPTELSYDV